MNEELTMTAGELAELKGRATQLLEFKERQSEHLLVFAPDVLKLITENERLRKESAFLREWGGRCQVEMEKQAARKMELRAALQCIYDETADYIRRNHLGDVHHNLSMQIARAALRQDDATNITTNTQPQPE